MLHCVVGDAASDLLTFARAGARYLAAATSGAFGRSLCKCQSLSQPSRRWSHLTCRMLCFARHDAVLQMARAAPPISVAHTAAHTAPAQVRVSSGSNMVLFPNPRIMSPVFTEY